MVAYNPPTGKCYFGARVKPRYSQTEAPTGTTTNSAMVAFEALCNHVVHIDHRYLSASSSASIDVDFTATPSQTSGGANLPNTIDAGRLPLVAIGQRSAHIWYEVASSTTHDADIVAQAQAYRTFFSAQPAAFTFWHEPSNYDNTKTAAESGQTPYSTTYGQTGDAIHSAAAGGWFKKAFAKMCFLWRQNYPEAMLVLCLQGINFNNGTTNYAYIDNWYPGDTVPSGITWRAADTTSVGIDPVGTPTHDAFGADAYQATQGTPSNVPTPDKLWGKMYHWATGTAPTGVTAPTVKAGRHDYPLWIPEWGCEKFTLTPSTGNYPKDKADFYTWLGDWLEGTGHYAGQGHPAVKAVIMFMSGAAAFEPQDWWVDGPTGDEPAALASFKTFAARPIFNFATVPPPPVTPWNINGIIGASG